MSLASLAHPRPRSPLFTPAAAAFAGRLLLGGVFAISGGEKLADPSATFAYIEAYGLPAPAVALVVAIFVELGGALALVLGAGARAAAGLLAAFCLATGLIFHADLSDPGQAIQLLKNLAIAGGLIQVAVFGAGRFSLDALRA
ncbi:DoxX family protein [uncultured Albimonas sp.]|uniref:DoxX family protein n=1 Tax=uncultured Albimonas sp. TaxID=1331701 RepID=UPI0030EC1203